MKLPHLKRATRRLYLKAPRQLGTLSTEHWMKALARAAMYQRPLQEGSLQVGSLP